MKKRRHRGNGRRLFSAAWLTYRFLMCLHILSSTVIVLISRHICRTAARLHIPLEYNIGYVAYNEAHNLQTYPCPDFWHIAANEGCTAIIGLDAHNNKDLETPVYYNRAIEELSVSMKHGNVSWYTMHAHIIDRGEILSIIQTVMHI